MSALPPAWETLDKDCCKLPCIRARPQNRQISAAHRLHDCSGPCCEKSEKACSYRDSQGLLALTDDSVRILRRAVCSLGDLVSAALVPALEIESDVLVGHCLLAFPQQPGPSRRHTSLNWQTEPLNKMLTGHSHFQVSCKAQKIGALNKETHTAQATEFFSTTLQRSFELVKVTQGYDLHRTVLLTLAATSFKVGLAPLC